MGVNLSYNRLLYDRSVLDAPHIVLDAIYLCFIIHYLTDDVKKLELTKFYRYNPSSTSVDRCG